VTTHATPLVGAALSRAVATLWAGLRVVVVDTETCVNPAGGLRIVSFAAVTCRAGSVRGKWQTLINPGTPIDRNSQRIHGVTDDHVDGEPAFIDVGASIVSQLTPADGEQVVFVAHNVGFDVGVLRAELEAAGLHLPTLPVIDTMGRLPGHVGVRPPSRGLADLLATLGLVNARPHDALADAVACAEAFVALMDCAAQQGLTDFDQLLADVSAGATTASVRPNSKAIDTPTASPAALPVEHLAQHAAVLSPRAGSRMLRTWRDEVLDCASLRCVHLTDKVAQAAVPDRKLLTELNTALLHLTGEGDVAGAATVAEATLPLLHAMKAPTTSNGLRRAALSWAGTHGTALTALGRCGPGDAPLARRHRRHRARQAGEQRQGLLAAERCECGHGRLHHLGDVRCRRPCSRRGRLALHRTLACCRSTCSSRPSHPPCLGRGMPTPRHRGRARRRRCRSWQPHRLRCGNQGLRRKPEDATRVNTRSMGAPTVAAEPVGWTQRPADGSAFREVRRQRSAHSCAGSPPD
jgi:DNA polymerase III epsilon subunit-like protein